MKLEETFIGQQVKIQWKDCAESDYIGKFIALDRELGWIQIRARYENAPESHTRWIPLDAIRSIYIA